MEEKKYTLREAKLELNKEECMFLGHDYNVITKEAGPVGLVCLRCGKKWDVHESNA